jgi:hypothetical protein
VLSDVLFHIDWFLERFLGGTVHSDFVTVLLHQAEIGDEHLYGTGFAQVKGTASNRRARRLGKERVDES